MFSAGMNAGWDVGAVCGGSLKVAVTLAFSPLGAQIGVDQSSHEPNRCGSPSVPCPGCHGSCSVVLRGSFQGVQVWAFACVLFSVYSSCCQSNWIMAENNQLVMSRTDSGICFH